MATDTVLPGGLRIGGDFTLPATGRIRPEPTRDKLAQEAEVPYPICLENARNATTGAPLTNSPSGSDLGIVMGTYGTNTPAITSGDVKNATTSRKCRIRVPIPEEYEAGETLKLRFRAGIRTTISSGACTLDAEAYRVGNVGGGDLVSTAAQSIRSTTLANYDFVITPTGLERGMELDVQLTIACVDSATVTAVDPVIEKGDLLADIRG